MAQVVVELTGDEAKLLRSLQKVIDQNSKTKDSFKKTGKESKASLEDVAQGAFKMVSAYASFQGAISLASAAIADQIALQKESLNIANEIAKSQSGAVKNLTGLSAQDKAKVLNESKKLQAEVGFADQKFIVDALGAGYSASGDIEATKSAVRASSELSRVTPEELSTITSGALDVSRGTGIKDAKKNLSFLLQAGAVSRVEDPAALARTLAPTIGSGVNTVAKQDKQEASREIAAVFSELNKFANDVKGESTKTNVTSFLAKMDEFFRTLPLEREKVNAQVAELEKKLAVTPLEQAQLKQADFDVVEAERKVRLMGKSTGPKAVQAQIDLEEARAKKAKLAEEVGLNEEEKVKYKTLKSQSEAMAGVVDSGEVFGRIKQFQESKGLRDKFLENPFGEAAFQGGFRELLTGGTDLAKGVETSKSSLGFDTATYNKTVAELETLTPELRVAAERARSEGKKQLDLVSDGKPIQGLITEIANDTLRTSRRNAIGGVIDYSKQGMNDFLAGTGENPMQTAALAMTNLEIQKQSFGDQIGGLSPADQAKVAKLDEAINKIAELAASFNAPQTAAMIEKQRELQDKQLQTLQSIDSKTGVANGPQAIRSQAEGAR